MLLERNKKLREVCERKTTVRKESGKDSKSRNILSKVQSRKTCCDVKAIQGSLKKPAAETRNSFVHATANNCKAKRKVSNPKIKHSAEEVAKQSTRPLVKKKSILKK
eukprot:TRINITY_DN1983_c0_g1_i11.p1 TRINITY_DN1983_c0_g1~~TRINITY_DN1983_c0_g1_i11.p1  ORF type:complete len:107 (+),score=38.56 TRINITY_DN1983_c0_g1_i11:211-531(+)